MRRSSRRRLLPSPTSPRRVTAQPDSLGKQNIAVFVEGFSLWRTPFPLPLTKTMTREVFEQFLGGFSFHNLTPRARAAETMIKTFRKVRLGANSQCLNSNLVVSLQFTHKLQTMTDKNAEPDLAALELLESALLRTVSCVSA